MPLASCGKSEINSMDNMNFSPSISLYAGISIEWDIDRVANSILSIRHLKQYMKNRIPSAFLPHFQLI